MKKLIKQNKWRLLISSLILLLPIPVALLLRDKGSASLPLHWGLDGEVDWMGDPLTAVLIMVPVFLVLHLACIFLTAYDNRRNTQSKKVLAICFWILPILSCFVCGVLYMTALGNTIEIASGVFVLLGILFAVMGNYMPKVKQNRTFGLKLVWTLASEENWNRTHRFAGKVWVIGGVLLTFGVFLPVDAIPFVLISVILVMAGIPTVYSYLLYKKQVEAGEVDPRAYRAATKYMPRWARVLVISLIVSVLAGCALICFTGDLKMQYREDAFTVEASYWEDLTVLYADVESIELRTEAVPATRVSGFGSPRLSLGVFQNEEFGKHIRYAYTQTDYAIVLTVDGKRIVLGGVDNEATVAIFKDLQARIAGIGGAP